MSHLNRPTDPYSPDWSEYWAKNPNIHKSIGAEAAEAGGDEGGDQIAEWAGGIEDEGLKSTLGKFESQDAFFQAAGINQDEPKDWREGLSEDLGKVAERFNSPEDALRSVAAFQKREGQVRVPGKDASEDDMKAYQKAIGVPETSDAYEFPEVKDMTDEIKAGREQWASRFHSLNMPVETAKKLIEMVGEDENNRLEAQIKTDELFVKSQEESLKAEWGNDYGKNKELANRAFKKIAEQTGLDLDGLSKIETKDGRLLMDRAEMLKIFSAFGREMSEGTLGPVLSENEKESMGSELRDLRKQISEAQAEGDSKRANALYQKEQSIISKMNGSQDIVGSNSRAA